MKTKMSLVIVLGALLLFLFSGCNMYYSMDTQINEDGSGKVVMVSGVSESYWQEMIREGISTPEEVEEFKKQATTITKDGIVYYCEPETVEFSTTTELEKELVGRNYIVHASKDTFYVTASAAAEEDIEAEEEVEDEGEEAEENVFYIEFKVTFPETIFKHIGGELSNDNKTITWDMEDWQENQNLYATTAKQQKKAISVNVVNNKIYKKVQTIKVTSGEGTVYLDDMLVTSGKTKAKNGQHDLIIVNQNGTRKIISFTVDTKAPIIKGVKKNKTYHKKIKLTFFDNESGVKNVTVNGKKISAKQVKKGYTIKNNGTYTVKATDKAGNVKTMKFTIKK